MSCHKRCYPHTSAAFAFEAEKMAETLLLALFEDKTKLETLEKEYSYSKSSLSLLKTSFKEYIHDLTNKEYQAAIFNLDEFHLTNRQVSPDFFYNLGVLSKKTQGKILHGQAKTELLTEVPFDQYGVMNINFIWSLQTQRKNTDQFIDYSRCIVMDETFLKIGKIQFYLIAAASKEGEILSWSLSKKRSVEEVRKVFLQAIKIYPFAGILISDSYGSYRKFVKEIPYPIIHIAHIHKKPHKRATIYQQFRDEESNKLLSIEVGVSTDIFVTSGEKFLFANIKSNNLKKTNRPRGRPKGSKNRSKGVIEEEKKKKAAQPKRKRRPRNIFKKGLKLQVETNVEKNSLVIDSEVPENAQFHLLIMLMTVFQHFKGIHITSNYIELIFSVFKNSLNKGRRDTLRVANLDIETFVLLYNAKRSSSKLLEDLITQYIKEHPPPVGMGYRQIFNSPTAPYCL